MTLRTAIQADAHCPLLPLRVALSFIWLVTGVLVLHPDYREVGLSYLARAGMTHTPGAAALMYATCAAEVALAVMLLVSPWRFLYAVQIALVVAFTGILVAVEPALLVHPFGMLTKNIPIIGIAFVLWRNHTNDLTEVNWKVLRVFMAAIWITEGIFPKVFFQTPLEIAVVAESGLSPLRPDLFLLLIGIAQAASGVLALFASAAFLRFLLAGQIAGLIVLPLLVSYQQPLLWVHPFGPMTKNIPLLVGTLTVFRCSYLYSK